MHRVLRFVTEEQSSTIGNKMTHLLADGAVLSRDEEPAGSDMMRANDAKHADGKFWK
jgi:hypothetical protein